MRRKRSPSGEELELWRKVTDTVTPLVPPPRRKKPEALPTEAKKAPSPPGPFRKERKPAMTAAVPAPPKAPPGPPAPPPLHPIDRRTRTRLTRGAISIDRRIDLHGMTQAAAEQRLRQFLADAQAGGAKVVLVITGKGKPMRGYDEAERGVLRRMVPMWLSAPGLRNIVIGYDEAAPSHGGAGALYVRIRRQKS